MLVNEQKFEVALVPQSIVQIEQFVETICDQLLINDTYYGSILMSLTELFSICSGKKDSETIIYHYKTDYQTIKIVVQLIDNEIINCFKKPVGPNFDKRSALRKGVFLIKSLTDSVEILSSDSIELTFDISAIHNTVYKYRFELLSEYFAAIQKEFVIRRNDNL